MTVIMILFGALIFATVCVKVTAGFFDIDNAGFGTCLFAVILSSVATIILSVFFGEGFFIYFIALLISGFIYSLLFSVNALVGFVVAFVSLIIQVISSTFLIGFGLAVFAL